MKLFLIITAAIVAAVLILGSLDKMAWPASYIDQGKRHWCFQMPSGGYDACLRLAKAQSKTKCEQLSDGYWVCG